MARRIGGWQAAPERAPDTGGWFRDFERRNHGRAHRFGAFPAPDKSRPATPAPRALSRLQRRAERRAAWNAAAAMAQGGCEVERAARADSDKHKRKRARDVGVSDSGGGAGDTGRVVDPIVFDYVSA